MGNTNRKPVDELKYGIRGQRSKDPRLLKRYEGEHPDLKIPCLIEKYADGFIIYRDPKTLTFLPGTKTWGALKGRRGRDITALIDDIADKDTWIALLLRHFMITQSKDDEISLRAMGQLLDRYFGKPVQNQSIEVANKDGDAIKAKLNDMFGINDGGDPLFGINNANNNDSTEKESTEATETDKGDTQSATDQPDS